MIDIIYDNKIKFEFAEKGHRYTVAKLVKDDLWTTPTPVTGITTITSIIAKDALIMWAAKLAAYHMRDNWEKAESIAALAEDAKKAHKDESKKAAGIGSVGHKMIELLLRGKEVKMPTDKDLLAALENVRIQHENFEKAFKPKTLHVEKPMYSLVYDFAGTDDRLCDINGKTILIDYKTSNRGYYNPDGIYASNFAQLGGQAILVEEMLGLEVEDAMIVNFAKDSAEYRFKSITDMGLTVLDAKIYFLNCLGLYNINKQFEWRVNK